MARTERESDRKREVADLLVLPRQPKSLQNDASSSEKLEHTGPAEKKRAVSVPQREQLASTSEQSLPKEKGTEPSVQSTRTSIPLKKDSESQQVQDK